MELQFSRHSVTGVKIVGSGNGSRGNGVWEKGMGRIVSNRLWWRNGQCCRNFSLQSKFDPKRWSSSRGWTPQMVVAVRAETGEGSRTAKHDYKSYQALLRGGNLVVTMLKEMTELLEDIAGMESQDEAAAVEMAAASTVGQRLDSLEESFMMALDYMIKDAIKDGDDKKKWLLEVIKETTLTQLAQRAPSEVQVVGTLCQTKSKEARQDTLRRCAGGGGTFTTESGGKVVLPAANLNNIANQADDIIASMEEKQRLQDRKLLARLVLIREEARSLLGGGILDERNNNRGLKSLPEPEVNFLTKMAAIKPGPLLHQRLENVMRGQDEGADTAEANDYAESESLKGAQHGSKHQGTKTKDRSKILPVRPGLFLETLTKVIGGMYTSNAARGVTVQQLEWIHRETLAILQKIAFP